MTALIDLNQEQYEEIERLAGLGYSDEELAMYFDVPKKEFLLAAQDKKHDINYHIKRGVLIAKAKEMLNVSKSAEGGNITAIQQLGKIRYQQEFELVKKKFLYTSDISADLLHKLEGYIQSGCKTDISSDESIYIEVLTMMNSMRRKYGRSNTIKFFTEKPFEFKYTQARDMYEHALNLFYADSKIEKKALRRMKAEQLEEAAMVVKQMATKPKDFEIYGKLISESAALLQLDQPDPPEVPAGTYDRPYKVYSLDPTIIGLPAINRNALAKQIDAIEDLDEADRERVKGDAMINDVLPLDEMLDEYEEETKSQE